MRFILVLFMGLITASCLNTGRSDDVERDTSNKLAVPPKGLEKVKVK